MGGFAGEGLPVSEMLDNDQVLAEIELALDPALVEQLDTIDKAFDTEAGRSFEMTQAPIERKKDGYAQGGWAAHQN